MMPKELDCVYDRVLNTHAISKYIVAHAEGYECGLIFDKLHVDYFIRHPSMNGFTLSYPSPNKKKSHQPVVLVLASIEFIMKHWF